MHFSLKLCALLECATLRTPAGCLLSLKSYFIPYNPPNCVISSEMHMKMLQHNSPGPKYSPIARVLLNMYKSITSYIVMRIFFLELRTMPGKKSCNLVPLFQTKQSNRCDVIMYLHSENHIYYSICQVEMRT